jgi:hypothetical protein
MSSSASPARLQLGAGVNQHHSLKLRRMLNVAVEATPAMPPLGVGAAYADGGCSRLNTSSISGEVSVWWWMSLHPPASRL